MKRLIITSSIILSVASAVSYGLTRPTSITAEVKSPIVAQVENHEERIGDLEIKTDATQTQVNQNTADIEAVRQDTGTAPAPQVKAVVTPVAPIAEQPVQEPAPAAEPPQAVPTPEPRTITAVTDTPGTNPELDTHICRYTLYSQHENNRQGPVHQPNSIPCHKVGEVLPRY